MPAAAKKPSRDKKKTKNEAKAFVEEASQKWIYTKIAGKTFKRVRFGEETVRFELDSTDKTCSCGVRLGMFHIFGCAQAECPACHTREVDCRCKYYDN